METTAEITKTCKRCNTTKSLNKFYQTYKGYYFTNCKTCSRIISSEYKKIDKYKEKEKLHKQTDEYRIRANYLKRTQEKDRIQAMLSNAKRRARKKGKEFTITKKDIVIPKFCPLLQIPLIWGSKGNYENTPSLDCINPNLGYTPDNICVISKKANSMKNSATKEDMKIFLKNIVNYMNINIKDIVRTIGNVEPIELKDKELLG